MSSSIFNLTVTLKGASQVVLSQSYVINWVFLFAISKTFPYHPCNFNYKLKRLLNCGWNLIILK